MPAPACIFVAWDSTIPRIHTVLERAVERHRDGDHRFLAVGYHADAPAVGDLRTQVVQTIHAAQAIIAAVDRPNATVGWEIGYALAKGLPLGLIRTSNDLPEWTRFGLFRGQLSTSAVVDFDRLLAVAARRAEFTTPPAPLARGGRTLLLCAGPEELATVAEDLPALHPLDLSAARLADLPTVLADAGRAAWVIGEPGPDQVRDGSDNGLLGIAAGFLEGCGVPVELFLHKDARDQQHLSCARPYDSLRMLVDQLRQWEERTRPGPGGTPPPPPAPLEAWRRDTIRQHRDLLPFVHQTLQHALLREQPVQLGLDTGGRLHCLPEELRLPEDGVPATGHGQRVPLRAVIEQGLREADATGHAGRWLVVAEPGAGKTTLARHLCRTLAEEAGGQVVPVYVPLAGLNLEHPFTWAGRTLHADEGRVAAADLEAALHAAAGSPGRVWLFLDGLDEVAGAHLSHTRARIGTWAEALPGVVFVVLSRPTAVSPPPPGGFRAVTVAPLTTDDQAALAALLLPAPQVARLQAEVLCQPRIRVLAGNPLLLTLVAIVAERAWEQGGAAPRHRLDLYEQAVEHFLERGWGEGGQRVREPDHALPLLEELALHLQGQDGEAWSRRELGAALDALRQADPQVGYYVQTWGSNRALLDDLDQHAGLLGQRDGPRAPWRFLHRSFREYLAARALARRPIAQRLAMLDGLGDRPDREAAARFATRWGEVLGMLCGLVDEGEAHLSVLCERAPSVALRALPAMEHLSPARRVEVLADLADQGWRQDTLAAVRDGLPGAAAQAALDAVAGDAARPPVQRLVALGLLDDAHQPARLAREGRAAVALVQAARRLGWLAARLVPRIVGLEPGQRLELLLGLAFGAWTADDLDDTLDAMGADTPALWAEVGPDTPVERLGVLWYALERHGTAGQGWRHPAWPALRQRFLAACGRDRPPPRQEWVDIPGGTFDMGAPDGEGLDDERPQHPVRVSPFRMGATPVTVATLAAFQGRSERSRLPAVEVDWFTARLVAAWLGGRLPTEAEWEHACRAGTTSAYWSGDAEADLARAGWYEGNSGGKLHPVGEKPANPWGLHDMHGNCWEWCEDRYGPYVDDEAADPAGPSRGANRVLRGGSGWNDPERCRSAARGRYRPGNRDDGIGFRVVLPARSPAGS